MYDPSEILQDIEKIERLISLVNNSCCCSRRSCKIHTENKYSPVEDFKFNNDQQCTASNNFTCSSPQRIKLASQQHNMPNFRFNTDQLSTDSNNYLCGSYQETKLLSEQQHCMPNFQANTNQKDTEIDNYRCEVSEQQNKSKRLSDIIFLDHVLCRRSRLEDEYCSLGHNLNIYNLSPKAPNSHYHQDFSISRHSHQHSIPKNQRNAAKSKTVEQNLGKSSQLNGIKEQNSRNPLPKIQSSDKQDPKIQSNSLTSKKSQHQKKAKTTESNNQNPGTVELDNLTRPKEIQELNAERPHPITQSPDKQVTKLQTNSLTSNMSHHQDKSKTTELENQNPGTVELPRPEEIQVLNSHSPTKKPKNKEESDYFSELSFSDLPLIRQKVAYDSDHINPFLFVQESDLRLPTKLTEKATKRISSRGSKKKTSR